MSQLEIFGAMRSQNFQNGYLKQDQNFQSHKLILIEYGDVDLVTIYKCSVKKIEKIVFWALCVIYVLDVTHLY